MKAAFKIVAPTPAPAPTYVEAPDGARLRVDILAAQARRLQGCFSGSFITSAKLADARELYAEIARDLPLLGRVLK